MGENNPVSDYIDFAKKVLRIPQAHEMIARYTVLDKEAKNLKKKLKADDRQVIVTTIQKLQRLVTKRLKEGTSEYNKIRGLKIAFVVDECHRAVSPGTKRELENRDVDLVMRTLSGL